MGVQSRPEYALVEETKRARSFSHPNIIKVIESGQIRGSGYPWECMPFYLMEYVDGSSLKDILSKEVPSLGTRVRWIVELGEALKYIHSHGNDVVHRDIKPDNIVIEKKNRKTFFD